MKKKFKEVLSLVLAAAMVLMPFALPAETVRAEEPEGTGSPYGYAGKQTDGEGTADNGIYEPDKTKLKLYYYITDSEKKFADYGVHVLPETAALSEAGPQLALTQGGQKYYTLRDAGLENTIKTISGKWGYVGLDSADIEEVRFVTASGGESSWNALITTQGLAEAYYVYGFGWFKDSAGSEEIKKTLQNIFYIVGSFNGWKLADAKEMTATDEGYILTLSLEAGDYEFTPVQDKDNFAWEYQYLDKDAGYKNYAFTLEDERTVTFIVKNVNPANGTADVAVYKNYTVTFKDGDKVLDTQTVREGEAAAAPEAPAKEGYIFDGWDLAFGNVTSDLAVSAKWVKIIKNYTVTFKDGDKVLGTQTVREGEAAAAPEAPAKAGYVFSGWDKAFSNITSDLTVNATWKPAVAVPKTYTVTFMDGTAVLSKQTIAEGKAAAAPVPAKTGYTLSWDKAFSNVTSDLTVNAKWTANTYEITYHVNGGSKLKTAGKNVTYDAAYGALAAPKRVGYTFSGWYTAKTKGTKITAAGSVKITANTTLYAHWSKVAKPAKVKKPTVKNSAKKTMKVSFKKIKGAAGYEIRYSTKSNMKKAKKVATKKTSVTVKKLAKGKTYYVQVRAYKLDSAGKKVYGKAYSTKAKVTIKK